jgi:hypothetical protein
MIRKYDSINLRLDLEPGDSNIFQKVISSLLFVLRDCNIPQGFFYKAMVTLASEGEN